MKTFIHLADSHLRDTQFTRRSRGEDFAKALEAAVLLGLKRGIKTFLHAGDLIDTVRPGPKVVRQVKALDAYLATNQATMLVISGNHDYTDPHWAEVACPELGEERPYGLRVIDNQLVTLPDGLTVYGAGFLPRERFLAAVQDMPPADVLLYHGMVQELMPFKSEAALKLDELPTDRYRMIALGDIHITEYVNHQGCLVGYPGSTELCALNEPPVKTVSIVRIDAAAQLVDQVVLPTRKVLRYTLKNEQDMEQALIDVQTHKDADPIIRIDYASSLPDVLLRFSARVDPEKAILRPMPLFDGVIAPNQGDDSRESLEPADMVSKFFPPGGALHALTVALIDPKANVGDLVDAYVNQTIDDIPTAAQAA